MALIALNDEINEARIAYLEVRGRLREDSELCALDGVYNALKSPQRLLVDQAEASVDLDQKCESLEYMITSLHRVLDLMRTLRRRYSKRKLWCQILNCELHSSLFTIQDLTPIFLTEKERGGLGAALEFAIINFVFDALGIEKLNCEVIEGNSTVVKLHKKFLFKEEGFRESNIIKSGNRIGVPLCANISETLPNL